MQYYIGTWWKARDVRCVRMVCDVYGVMMLHDVTFGD